MPIIILHDIVQQVKIFLFNNNNNDKNSFKNLKSHDLWTE